MAQHAYGVTGVTISADYATADGCIGFISDCMDTTQDNYPCAFANVDLTGTPVSMVNDFGAIPAPFSASSIALSDDKLVAAFYGCADVV